MARQYKRFKEEPPGPRLNVRLPDSLHRRLKVYSTLERQTIPRVIEAALREHLKDFQPGPDK